MNSVSLTFQPSVEQTYRYYWMVVCSLLAVLAPFTAFLYNCFLRNKTKASGFISTIAIFFSLVCSIIVFANIWNQGYINSEVAWFTVGRHTFQAGILLNNLTVLMMVLVTAIALPVHIYSIAYMKNDSSYTRYFGYLSFFCFSMMALVVVNHMLLFYAFWELVGFSSYLLIGFWFKRPKAVLANKRAFIMNRIGDVALLAGILMLYTHYHTFDMVSLFGDKGLVNAVVSGTSWFMLPGICFLLGAMAKSAQFPLHTWLPDAMEGPTSVSALIHAATMVAAGIFLIGRVYPVFNHDVLLLMTCIGCFTAFMAATIALTQNDLKRILAYSTISQLGLMMMAMGIGANSSALFHLATHAFFKCLLFLSAGVIIHEMQHLKEMHQLNINPQNILNMGGLRKLMPVTFVCCTIAAIALAGLPFTSAFLSKDGILIQAFQWAANRGLVYYIIPVGAVLSSILTAFYIARLVFKVFFGTPALQADNRVTYIVAHDGSWLFKAPLIILACCCFFPLFSLNPFEYTQSWLYRGLTLPAILGPVTGTAAIPVIMMVLTVLMIGLAWLVYVKGTVNGFSQTGFLYKLSFNEWYIDHFYLLVIVKNVIALSSYINWFDKNVVDGLVNWVARSGLFMAKIAAWFDTHVIDDTITAFAGVFKRAGNLARGLQGGKLQGYLFTMILIVVIVYVIKTFI